MHTTTPKSMRLQIGIFGRTNVGKSSFLNLVAGQDVAVTSPLPGTTTDVVEKAMELLPVGPVLFLDTGGLDDRSELAGRRIQKTRLIFDRADVAVLVVEPEIWGEFEQQIYEEVARRNIPLVVVVNKADLRRPGAEFMEAMRRRVPALVVCSSLDYAARDQCVNAFKKMLADLCPADYLAAPALIGDLLPPRGLAILIVPIDLEAPKGRLILPQVQAIRDALDHNAAVMVVKECDYLACLDRLKNPPDLVVCDSQVVDKMVAETPSSVRCTTFSILFARFKGDLRGLVRGAAAIRNLRMGDKVLIAEACSHHALADDIGRVKIPRWLRQFTGLDLQIDICAGRDYPPNLGEYNLIVHCGSCMLTRRETLARLQKAREAGVPITNYGVCISFLKGVLARVLEPFPEALKLL